MNKNKRDLMRYTCLVALVGSIFFSAGCAGQIISGAIEDKIEDRLPELIGTAKSYDVTVHGSSRKMMRGRIGEILIHGEGVWATPDLCVDVIDIRMKNVVVDKRSSVITSVDRVTFEAMVREKSLNEYLKSVRCGKPRVELLAKKMVVKARPEVLHLSANVTLTGILIPKGNKLDFRVERLKVIGIGAPKIAIRAVEDWINPVVEFDFPNFTPELESVTIAPGELRITGTTNIFTGPANRTGANK